MKLETVGDVVAAYLKETELASAARAAKSGHAARAEKSTRSVLKRFAAAHGHLRVGDPTEALFLAWVDDKKRCGTEQSKQWALYRIQRPFRWAKGAGLLPELAESVFGKAMDRRHLKRVEQRKQAEVPVSALQALTELLEAHPQLRNLIAPR